VASLDLRDGRGGDVGGFKIPGTFNGPVNLDLKRIVGCDILRALSTSFSYRVGIFQKKTRDSMFGARERTVRRNALKLMLATGKAISILSFIVASSRGVSWSDLAYQQASQFSPFTMSRRRAME
jgi:hypothetical protein